MPSPERTKLGLRAVSCALALLAATCSRFGAVYPPRPPETPGAPLADPAPARIVVHLAMTSGALAKTMDDAVPKAGDGTVPLLGGDRRYQWQRTPLDVTFAAGRIALATRVVANVKMPLGSVDLPFEIRVQAEPVINTSYTVKLQATEVHVSSSDRRLKLVDDLAGVFDKIGGEIDAKLKDFSYDLSPALREAYARLGTPVDLPIGDAKGCAELKVLAVEAGPTVLADGIEKEIALVVAPSVTLPCASDGQQGELPRLANVAALPSGPFTVTVPIAASYDELARAMTMTFTDGKLFFSNEHPKLYLEKPELYESEGALVLRLHISGSVHELGIDTDMDGDLFLTGHPSLVDNELRLPDLEPTIETKNLLLSLKALTDADTIRNEARRALRLDIGERLVLVRAKLSSELTFAAGDVCLRGFVDKVEVTGIHPHASYLRVYVTVTARASVSMPCSGAEGAKAGT